MSTKSRLDKLYKTCPRIRLPEDCKILFIADRHRNCSGPADDFSKNDATCQRIFLTHFFLGYFIVILGDDDDLWECSDESKIRQAHPESFAIDVKYREKERLIEVWGNHDNKRKGTIPEAVVLQIGDDLEIFCAHGHQGDLFNDRLWWIGQHFVRYLWVPLQWLGLHDAQRAKRRRHELQEIRLNQWAQTQPFVSVFGHTHLLADIGKYKDAGSWVQMGGEGIAYENGKFSDRHF